MKNLQLSYYAFLMVLIFFISACVTKTDPEPDPPDPTTSLDGYWDRGDLIIYIQGSEGTFYEINSGEWKRVLDQGFIAIGSLKFRYLTQLKADSFFSGQSLWYYGNSQNIENVAWSETGEFNLRNEGNTLYVNTKDPWSDNWNFIEYTRVYPK